MPEFQLGKWTNLFEMPQTQFKDLFLLVVLCQCEPLQKGKWDIESSMDWIMTKERDCDWTITTI